MYKTTSRNRPSSLVLLFLFLFCYSVQDGEGVKVSLGGCPTQDVQQNFDTERYFGEWFEVEKYSLLFGLHDRCRKVTYSRLVPSTLSFNTIDNQLQITRVASPEMSVLAEKRDLLGRTTVAVGTAIPVDATKNEGRFNVNLEQIPIIGIPLNDNGNYQVLQTDYDNYSVVWSCKDLLGVTNSQSLIILTRVQDPAPEIIDTARKVVTDNGLDISNLRAIDQTGCV